MKKSLLLASILLFSLLVAACSSDDDNPSDPTPPANSDPTVSITITGDVNDNVSFTIPGGVVNDVSVVGSFSGAADLLSLNIMKLPTGYSFSLIGNRESFGEGDYVASGMTGYGAYTDVAQNRIYVGTASTITLSSFTLLQDVVQATYSASGSFTATMEDTSTPPKVIQIEGTFENITLSVNE